MKKNILLIDDSALMRRVICDIIASDNSFQIADICKDGQEGYEKLKEKRYDAVLLDVNMPRMDGLEQFPQGSPFKGRRRLQKEISWLRWPAPQEGRRRFRA